MTRDRILGVILAGGASRRFGADKSAALLGGRPLLAWVVERARPQVETLLLNANDPETGKGVADVERLADDAPGEGPLAGILATLVEAERRGFRQVASFACDTPFFPDDTAARLTGALQSSAADYALARCDGTAHRMFALWPVESRVRLERAFAGGVRSMHEVEHRLRPGWAEFAPESGPDNDPFFNINTRDDLETAERWLSWCRGI